eukprot:9094549-Alexandrium_andersonii.AAC.1
MCIRDSHMTLPDVMVPDSPGAGTEKARKVGLVGRPPCVWNTGYPLPNFIPAVSRRPPNPEQETPKPLAALQRWQCRQ